ncbi:MAG: hypothetical protein KC444_05365 [Nitrosopumilus sp.]|nr:hypothetical protein [Nitrosopumilus sp.]
MAQVRSKIIESFNPQKDYGVDIPGSWNSSFDPVKYFQVLKNPGDPLYREYQ